MTADVARIQEQIAAIGRRLTGDQPFTRQTPTPNDSTGRDVVASLRFIASKPTWLRGVFRELRTTADRLVDRLLADYEAASRVAADAVPPILMVCGSVNSGKSSLVASFLSDENRPRVLTGRSDEAGTHRFVFWLPQQWRDDEDKHLRFSRLLAEVFPRAAEPLAVDPKTAWRQYNAQDTAAAEAATERPVEDVTAKWETPLVAYDSRLDAFGVALLDCPDVQSGSWSGGDAGHRVAREAAAVATERFRSLISVGRIASATVVVTAASALGDVVLASLVQSLRESLPRTDVFLAVNQVPKRYGPRSIFADVAAYPWSEKVDAILMAYDFRGRAAAEMRRSLPSTVQPMLSSGEELPSFFLLAADSAANPGYPANPDIYLPAIAKTLRASELEQQHRQSAIVRLVATARETRQLLERYELESLDRHARLNAVVRDAIVELTADTREGQPSIAEKTFTPKLQLSRALLAQIESSLERTAPAYARVFLWPSFRIKRWFQSTRQAAEQYVPAMANLGGQLRRQTDQVLAKFNAGKTGRILTERRYGQALLRYDAAGDLPSVGGGVSTGAADAVTAAAITAIERFQRASDVQLIPEQLDALTTSLWKNMPIGQRLKTTLAPAAMVLAPLAAVVMIPFDMGTTHVLVYASLKELLVAGIAGASWAAWRGDQLPSVAETGAAWQQLADLYATTTDAISIDRQATERSGGLTNDAWPGGWERWHASQLPPHIDYADALSIGLAVDGSSSVQLGDMLDELERAVQP